MSSCIIRLLDGNKIELLDSLSGDYEDSFSLDSFQDLCKAFENSPGNEPKSFIIARVQTNDITNPSKAYYSYYDAFQLNKVLFRTQIIYSRKYIHRLHVLNPLTNTDIIGNVDYFIVSRSDSATIESAIATTPLKKEIEHKVQPNWTYNHRIMRDGGDSDDTLPSKALDFLGKTPKELQFQFNDVFPCRTKRINSLNITVKIPDSNILMGDSKVFVTPSTATRFNMPLTSESATIASSTKRRNDQLLCYRNAVSASIVPESFLEWARLLKTQSQSSKTEYNSEEPITTNSKEILYDAVFCGTDDDYLCKKDMRDLFLKNALSPDDYKLFEMPEIKEEVSFDPVDTVPETARCSMM